MRPALAFLALMLVGGAAAAAPPAPTPALIAAVNAPTRSPANIARDRFRHPIETLAFFGVKPTDTVVEIWPSGGWYTEILGPYLAAHGTLYAAGPDEKGLAAVKAKQSASPSSYRFVKFATFPARPGAVSVPAGSADVVLTFRNVHNWRFGVTDQTQAAFDQMFAMLKPGGTLGVVEHHSPEASGAIEEARSGYMSGRPLSPMRRRPASGWLTRARSTRTRRTPTTIQRACGPCHRASPTAITIGLATPPSAKATE